MSFRHGLLLGPLAAAIVALPALLRPNVGLLGFVMLMAAVGFVLGPFIGGLRVPAYRNAKVALLLGLAVGVLPMSVLATTLKVGTHHRPLGGATFAVVAGIVVLGLALGVSRLLTWQNEQESRRVRTAVGIALLLLAVAGGLAVPWLFVRTYSGSPALARAVLDGSLAIAIAALGAFVPVPRAWHFVAARAGLWVWIVSGVVALGLGRSAELRARVSQSAPVLAAPIAWLGG